MSFCLSKPVDNVELKSELKPMEQLSINNGNGQSYGYILYRTKLSGSQLRYLQCTASYYETYTAVYIQSKLIQCTAGKYLMYITVHIQVKNYFVKELLYTFFVAAPRTSLA